MKLTLLGFTPNQQSKGILVLGVVFTFVVFYGLTNQFKGVTIPQDYNVLIGK